MFAVTKNNTYNGIKEAFLLPTEEEAIQFLQNIWHDQYIAETEDEQSDIVTDVAENTPGGCYHRSDYAVIAFKDGTKIEFSMYPVRSMHKGQVVAI